jgi:hypothetical protein
MELYFILKKSYVRKVYSRASPCLYSRLNTINVQKFIFELTVYSNSLNFIDTPYLQLFDICCVFNVVEMGKKEESGLNFIRI